MSKKLYLIMALIICITFTGCENKRELDELGIVLGVAIDRTPEGKIMLTVQVAKPGEMKAGGGEDGGGGGSDPVSVMTTQGRTMFEAVRNMTTISSKKLFFSHNQVVIFGEDMAKHGVDKVIDFLERDPELRTEVPILVAKGKAGDLMKLPGNLERISALEINKSTEAVEASAKSINLQFYEFLRSYLTKGFTPVAPLIEKTTVDQMEHYRITGLAVFKEAKLIGTLNAQETRGFLWIAGKIQSGIIVLNKKEFKESPVSLEIKNAKSKITAKFIKQHPQIEVAVEETSSLGEIAGPLAVNSSEKLKILEKAQTKEIQSDADAAIKKSLGNLKADIFGFGHELYRSNPKKWAAIEKSWDQKLPTLKIKLKIKSNIEITGEKTGSTAAAKEER